MQVWYLWRQILYVNSSRKVYGRIRWGRVPKRYYKTEKAAQQALKHFIEWERRHSDSIHIPNYIVLPKGTVPVHFEPYSYKGVLC